MALYLNYLGIGVIALAQLKDIAMFSFEKTIIIDRTPHEVFTYIADPSFIPKWRKDVTAVKSGTESLHAGDKFEEMLNFNGPQTNTVEVVDSEEDRRLIFKIIDSSTSYLPLREMWFEDENGHTKLTVKVSAQTDGFTRLIQPIAADMFSIKWESYLFHLKRILESHSQNRIAA